MKYILLLSYLACFTTGFSQSVHTDSAFIRENYTKREVYITMRDGVRLFTSIYAPKDSSRSYPFLMTRTPCSVAPYGDTNFAKRLGPNHLFIRDQYIFIYKDVRGRHMSEGQFHEMTPAIDNKINSTQVDEGSDTYDTVDWLLKNIRHNNGKVGIYGISYPGFYATASLPNAHPAIKAASLQAPVTDEFEGDDAYHRGAFFLMDNFSFENFFDAPRTEPRQRDPQINPAIQFEDAYDFYLKMGALHHFNDSFFHSKARIWNEYLEHDTKDSYWQARNIRTHLYNIKPATLVVGGWFDAEDMFGALNTYKAIEQQNRNNNYLVMAPWTHGAWEAKKWDHFAGYQFGQDLNETFQQLEFDFFGHYLKDKNGYQASEATVFITGSNKWKSFESWPPKGLLSQKWMLNANHQLLLQNGRTTGKDSYISDPSSPVPYINKRSDDRVNEYMAADQTFASQRNDVLYYQSDNLANDMSLLGPINANLWVNLSGTDADFVVKLIDVLPDSNHTQQLVRAEVLRGKFRNSWLKPEAFVPGQPTLVKLQLNDVAHTFLKGHRIMVQVQSSWFPLVDRNPQQFIDIPTAKDSDYKTETITILHDDKHPSFIEAEVMKPVNQ